MSRITRLVSRMWADAIVRCVWVGLFVFLFVFVFVYLCSGWGGAGCIYCVRGVDAVMA